MDSVLTDCAIKELLDGSQKTLRDRRAHLLTPKVFEDDRGFFLRELNARQFFAAALRRQRAKRRSSCRKTTPAREAIMVSSCV